jgi:hypothetical protein
VSAIVACGLIAAIPASDALGARSRLERPRRPLGSVCLYSHSSMDDPIVHPGVPGAAHQHDFFGNVSTDAFSTAESLAAADSTCRLKTDASAYWAPALYADDVAVTPIKARAYYVRKVDAKVSPPPLGLRIVAGGQKNVRFTCIVDAMPQRLGHMVRGCGDGRFAIGIRFPDCWNGVDLDSADHRSHMAYSDRGACPATHPVALAGLRLYITYPSPSEDALLTLASGDLTSAHADFFNAWHPEMVGELTNFCLNGRRPRNCSKRVPKAFRNLDRELSGAQSAT